MHGFLWLKHGLHHAHHGEHPHRVEAFIRWLRQPAVIGFLIMAVVFTALLLLAIYAPVELEPYEIPYGYPGF